MADRAVLKVPDEVACLIRNMHPILKRKIRAGLKMVSEDPESGKSLKNELQGLRSLRVSRFRIIYRVNRDQIIEIVAIGPRERIYQETLVLVRRDVSPR